MNNAYINLKLRSGKMIRVLAPEARVFKETFKEALDKLPKHLVQAIRRFASIVKAGPDWLSLRVSIGLPLYTEEGKARQYDCSNRIKMLEDALCEWLGIDDTYILKVSAEKYDTGMPYSEPFEWRLELERLNERACV